MSHQSMSPKLKNYGNNSAFGRSSDNSEETQGMIKFEKKHVGLKKNLHLHMGGEFLHSFDCRWVQEHVAKTKSSLQQTIGEK